MRKNIGKIKVPSLCRRHRRIISIRKKISGTADRPRVCIIKSNKHLNVQIVDDVANKVIGSVGTFGKNAPEGVSNSLEGAKVIGEKVAVLLKENKITNIVFDRKGYKYTGKVTAFVNSLRENKIQV